MHKAAWKTYGKGKLDNLEDVPVGSILRVSGFNSKKYVVHAVKLADP